jgi:hypothetical protein
MIGGDLVAIRKANVPTSKATARLSRRVGYPALTNASVEAGHFAEIRLFTPPRRGLPLAGGGGFAEPVWPHVGVLR